MSKTLFIQAQSVGVQADLFNVYYTVVGDPTKYPAVDLSGNGINPITAATLLAGFYILVPDTDQTIYVCNYGEIGRAHV